MQRTCLLVNIQALIDLEKNTKVMANNNRAQLALQLLNEIKQIHEKIKSEKMEVDGQSEGNKEECSREPHRIIEDNIAVLLLQYEFEIHVLLGDDLPQKILSQAKSILRIPASFFVTLSSVAANHPHYTQCKCEVCEIIS